MVNHFVIGIPWGKHHKAFWKLYDKLWQSNEIFHDIHWNLKYFIFWESWELVNDRVEIFSSEAKFTTLAYKSALHY